MKLELYIDVFFLWNVVMNLALLSMTKTLRKQKTSGVRVIIASAFGGAIACVTTVITTLPSIISVILSYGLTGIIMIRIAFGKRDRKNFIYNYVYFLLVTFIFGGMMHSILSTVQTGYLVKQFLNNVLDNSVSMLFLLILLCTLFPLLSIVIKGIRSRTKEEMCYYNVLLKIKDKSIPCKGFLDTGNLLYDPLNGKPVILVDRAFIYLLYEETKMNYPQKIRFIPYHCIGKENGLLEGIRFDEVTIGNGEDSYTNYEITAAISEYEFKNKNDFQVLLHSELLGDSPRG